MIRGAIEQVTHNRVTGWIWSPDVDLAGRTVLAFLDMACIGAGKVDGFRGDLKAAGLGTGRAGFSFNLTYRNPADAPRVVVKLEGSDAVLIQAGSRVAPPAGRQAGGAAAPARDLAALNWMRARGWIGQPDHDFLRFIRQVGAYGRTLAPGQEPGVIARHLLGLHRMRDAEVTREKVPTIRDLRHLAVTREAASGPGEALALWSAARFSLPVVEGSHAADQPVRPDEALPPGIAYPLGPDRLLVLDARVALGPGAALPAEGVEAFGFAA